MIKGRTTRYRRSWGKFLLILFAVTIAVAVGFAGIAAGETVVVEADEDGIISGTTNVAPGSEMKIELFDKTNSVDISKDGSFSTTFDLSDREPGDEFVLTTRVEDSVVNTTDGIVVNSLPPEYRFQIDNDGSVYTLGFPGPVNGTLADAFDTENQDIGAETTIYIFEDGGWVSKSLENIEPEALDAIVIVTDGTDGADTIDIQYEIETTQTPVPGEVAVTEGWNYVSAPAYQNVEHVFAVGNAREVVNLFESVQPRRSPTPASDEFLNYRFSGGDSVVVSPFQGYFVFTEDGDAIQSLLINGASDRSQSNQYLNISE